MLIADITVGAESAARVLDLPPQMGQVVTASLLLVTVSVLVLRGYRVVVGRARPAAPRGEPETAAEPEKVAR